MLATIPDQWHDSVVDMPRSFPSCRLLNNAVGRTVSIGCGGYAARVQRSFLTTNFTLVAVALLRLISLRRSVG